MSRGIVAGNEIFSLKRNQKKTIGLPMCIFPKKLRNRPIGIGCKTHEVGMTFFYANARTRANRRS